MKKVVNRRIQCCILMSFLGLLETAPLLAQTLECLIKPTGEGRLTCANVYESKGQVFIYQETGQPYNNPSLQINYTLDVKSDESEAKLQFNEGSLEGKHF